MDRSHQDPSMTVNCKNQSGFTPLHYASENGHFSIVQCLLRYTMDKNPKNGWGTTPLHYAAAEGTGYLRPCPSAPTIQTVSVKFWLCPQKNNFN